MKKIFIYVAVAAAFLAGRCSKAVAVREKTIVRTDTVRIDAPPLASTERVGEKKVWLQRIVHDTVAGDTVRVAVPIERKVYRDTSYIAWVSGFDASLDSIEIYRPERIVYQKSEARRWSLGVTAGVAATPRGVVPAVTVGLSYRLF